MLTKNLVEPRFLTKNDLTMILELEKLCFAEPWSVDNFLSELDRKFTHAYGVFRSGKLIGQCLAWFIPPEVHLLNLAVHPDFRHQGIGTQLMGDLIIRSHKKAVRNIFLETHASNLAALGLYSKLNFKKTGERLSYYPNNETAIMMTLEIGATRLQEIKAEIFLTINSEEDQRIVDELQKHPEKTMGFIPFNEEVLAKISEAKKQRDEKIKIETERTKKLFESLAYKKKH